MQELLQKITCFDTLFPILLEIWKIMYVQHKRIIEKRIDFKILYINLSSDRSVPLLASHLFQRNEDQLSEC